MRPTAPRLTALRPLAAALAGSVLLLSGCGVAGTNFQPGVAATVGDETVTVNRVDSLVTRYCSAIRQQLSDNNQVVPLSYFRSGITSQLALRSAAEQVAALYSVGPGETYRAAVTQIDAAVTDLPEDVQDAVREIETSDEYVADITTAVGRKQLRDRGQGDPAAAESTSLGEKTLTDWIDDHGIEIDPRFGVEIEKGAPVPVDSSVSFALSDSASKGAAASPDQEYAAQLPAASRCG